MTNVELQKEMKSAGFVVTKKIYLILSVASMFVATGIGIGTSQTQLATKVDEVRARQVAKEEVGVELKHYFSDVDGKILQTKLDYLIEQVDRLNKRLDRIDKR